MKQLPLWTFRRPILQRSERWARPNQRKHLEVKKTVVLNLSAPTDGGQLYSKNTKL